MDPIKSGASVYSTQAMKSKPASQAQESKDDALTKASKNKVTLSEEGKALLAALKDIDQESKESSASEKTLGDKVESFTYGALGMEHPDKLEEEQDGSYSAGQYLSAAATIGGILLLV